MTTIDSYCMGWDILHHITFHRQDPLNIDQKFVSLPMQGWYSKCTGRAKHRFMKCMVRPTQMIKNTGIFQNHHGFCNHWLWVMFRSQRACNAKSFPVWTYYAACNVTEALEVMVMIHFGTPTISLSCILGVSQNSAGDKSWMFPRNLLQLKLAWLALLRWLFAGKSCTRWI